ncbi:MAG: glycosyltransferase family 9 protein [Vicinamibacteria bacterium]|jgi:lipopolysaccharide heptosyltransferase I|nr:glycosyltransferase family 9 protein [Vicinamibacteria bacterium]
MKALIVRLSSIGDVIHTLPAAAALHRNGWDVSWLVEPLARSLLEGHPHVRRVFAVPKAGRATLQALRSVPGELRREGFEAALDFQGLWKSAAWARLAGARRVIGYARAYRREPLSSVLLKERVALPDRAVHVIDKNQALLASLGIDALGARECAFPDTSAHAARLETILGGLDDIVLLNPGGGWMSKLWPAERYGSVAAAVAARGLRPIVIFGPGEEDLAETVVAASRGRAVLAPPTSLLDLIELLRRACLIVAADTGPMQLACAIGTPVVALFGPTDASRNGPYAPSDVVVAKRPTCYPCYRRRCPVHAGIMRDIEVQDVLEAIDRRLTTGAARPGHVRL